MTIHKAVMLACDAILGSVKYPVIAQPKIDGVHYLSWGQNAVSRKLLPFENKQIQEFHSKYGINGICGEFTSPIEQEGDTLCSSSGRALKTHDRELHPDFKIFVFDFVPNENDASLPYALRYAYAKETLEAFQKIDPMLNHYEMIESVWIENEQDLLAYEMKCLEAGHEGIIVRDPNLPYKFGRCGKTFMGCWRIKRFIEEEVFITGIIEGETNTNTATKDNLGRTKRSSKKEGKVPNGMVGSLLGATVKDIFNPIDGKLLIKEGTEIKVNSGALTKAQLKYYYDNQDEIIGKYAKFSMMPYGTKDKPRFGQFVCFRDADEIEK